jgi:hypothetical protein
MTSLALRGGGMEVNVSWWNVVPYDRPRMSRIRAGRLREVRSIGIPDTNNIRENRVKLLTLFEGCAALEQANKFGLILPF